MPETEVTKPTEACEETGLAAPNKKPDELTLVFENSSRPFIHNFGGPEARQARLVFACRNNTAKSLGEVVGQTIIIREVFASRAWTNGKTAGEIEEFTRSVLITPTGEFYSSSSIIVAGFVEDVLRAYDCKPINPPIEVAIGMVKAARGEMFTIAPVVLKEDFKHVKP